MTQQSPSAPPPAQPFDAVAVRRRNTRLVLIVCTVIDILLTPLAAFWGVMTVMASDSGSTPAIDTYIAVNMSLPLAMICAPIVAWVLYFMKQHRIAPLAFLVPVLWAILAFALMFTLG